MTWPHRAPRPRPEDPVHPFRWSTDYLGLIIDVETDAGEARSGVSDDGTPWSHVLPHPYGEVRGTEGADGDAVDVYLGPDRLAPFVYVIQTKFPGGKRFDETKSMIGFGSQAAAERAFRASYGKPGFHLDTTRWPAAAWVEAMGRPEVASGKMAVPLRKAHGLEEQVQNRSVDEWRWISDLDPEDAEPILLQIKAKLSQWERIETKDGRKIALVNGAINDLDGFVSRHRAALKLLRMDPETGDIIRRLAKADQLHGGRADKKRPEDFDADALEEGTQHELEHTTDREIAREIAMDHLSEDPSYYKKLRKLEKGVRFVVDVDALAKARKPPKSAQNDPAQVSMFARAPAAPPSAAPAHTGPQVQVKAHVRQTEHGPVAVAPHMRHISAKAALQLTSDELREHHHRDDETGQAARAELARREARKKPQAEAEPPAPAPPTPPPPAPEPTPEPDPDPTPSTEDETLGEEFSRRFETAFASARDAREANLVPISQMRAEFPELAREEFDEQLFDLRKTGRFTLEIADGRHGAPPDDQVAGSIKESGRHFVFVVRRDTEAEEEAEEAKRAARIKARRAAQTPQPPKAPEPDVGPEQGPTPAEKPKRARKPKALKTEPFPEPPKATDTEKRGEGTITDVGEVLWGARKHTWKKGDQVTPENLEAIEALGNTEAHKIVTKHTVFGPYDHEADEGNGTSAGASYLKARLLENVSAGPDPNQSSRKWYVSGGDWLKHELDGLHSVDEVKAFLKDWEAKVAGHMVEDEVMTPAELVKRLGITGAKPTDDGSGGFASTYIYDYNDTTDEHVTDFKGQPIVRKRPKQYVIPHSALKAAGYATHIAVVHSEADKTKAAGYRLAKPIVGENAYAKYLFGLAGLKPTAQANDIRTNKLIRAVRGVGGAFNEKHHQIARQHEMDGDEVAWPKIHEGKKRTTGPVRKWERNFERVERVGGADLPDDVDGESLRDTFGFRGVQYGNWVEQGARSEHMKHAHGALLDLADLMGIEPKAIAHGGRLGLAFGARGGGSANAHYESATATINLTHTRGAGSLAHEWAHFFDNQMTSNPSAPVFEGRRVRSSFLSHGEGTGGLHPEVAAAYKEVMAAMRKRPDGKPTAFATDAAHLGDYWSRPHEMFARAFEAHIEDTLHNSGRRNTYLVAGTRVQYGLARKVGDKVVGCEPFPQGEERAHISAAMGKLIAAMSRHQSLQKALARNALRFVAHERVILDALYGVAP